MRDWRAIILGGLAAAMTPGMVAGEALAAKPAAPSADEAALQAAIGALATGRLDDASSALDTVLVSYEKQYRDDKRRIYSARTPDETIAYALLGASESRETIVLDKTWGEANFLKGFVLIDLKRPDEAGPFLKRAVELAPMESQFLAELGEWHKSRREWDEAYALFERAEQASAQSPEPIRQARKTRAMRGKGFVLIEQGKLDDAEKLFRDCLAINPDDRMASNELSYISSMRASARTE